MTRARWRTFIYTLECRAPIRAHFRRSAARMSASLPCRASPILQLPRLTTKTFAAAACNGADLSHYICNDPTAVLNGPEGLGRITAFLQTVKARHIVTSSEFFFGADPRRLAVLRDAFDAARLPLKVYFYVREPFEWLVSCYAQYVKSRSLTVDVNQYLLQALQDVRIADAVGDLQEVYGSSFELALYRRDQLKDRDICGDFFGRMGIGLGPIESPRMSTRPPTPSNSKCSVVSINSSVTIYGRASTGDDFSALRGTSSSRDLPLAVA